MHCGNYLERKYCAKILRELEMTNTFHPGDKVIYTNELCGPVDGLTLGNEYVVEALAASDCLVLEGMPKWAVWQYERFTLKDIT
jgi:hypothetical protein